MCVWVGSKCVCKFVECMCVSVCEYMFVCMSLCVFVCVGCVCFRDIGKEVKKKLCKDVRYTDQQL